MIRSSNIELLRILAIMGVIVLHYCNPNFGGAFGYVESGSISSYILYILVSVFACSVDLFIIISGYFLCKKKVQNMWKPIELIIQVVLFSEAIYIFRVSLGNLVFSFRGAFYALIPANYFVILYSVVYMISPFINIMINNLSCKGFRLFLVISVALFSVYPTAVDVLSEIKGQTIRGLSSIGLYGSQWGYTIVNFVLMYLIGAYIRNKINTIKTVLNIRLCLIIQSINLMVIVLWSCLNDRIGYITEKSAWEYCNPLIVLEAVVVFILFIQLDIKTNILINKFAEGAFSVFLLHSSFLYHIKIDYFCRMSCFTMLLHIILSAIIIYIICWCVHMLYHFIIDPIMNKIEIKPLELKIEYIEEKS